MRYLSLIVLVIGFLSCSHPQPEGGFIIHGHIKGLPDQYLYFDRDFHSLTLTQKDSFYVKNERFTLRGKVEEPVELDFYTEDFISFNGHLVVENSKIQYTSALNGSNDEKDIVSGSSSHLLYKRYQQIIDQCYQRSNCELKPETQEHLINHALTLVKEYPNHPVSLMGTNYLLKYLNTGYGSADMLEEIVELLSPSFNGQPEFDKLQSFTNATYLRQEGTPFIQYMGYRPDNIRARLSDYYGDGYLLVNCWASWCGPSREEYLYFKKVFDKYKNQGFKIVNLSFDTNVESWIKAIEQDDLKEFINLSELKAYESSISKAYCIKQVPDNFLLDKNGTIVKNNIQAEKLMDVLEELYVSY